MVERDWMKVTEVVAQKLKEGEVVGLNGDGNLVYTSKNTVITITAFSELDLQGQASVLQNLDQYITQVNQDYLRQVQAKLIQDQIRQRQQASILPVTSVPGGAIIGGPGGPPMPPPAIMAKKG